MFSAAVKRWMLAAIATALMAATQPQSMHPQIQVAQPGAPMEPLPPSYMISFYDLRQNQELDAIEHHLTTTDATVTQTNRDLVALEREISDMQGANRVWFWLLGGMITAIGVAFWRSGTVRFKKESDE
jgi:hypothetical protein